MSTQEHRGVRWGGVLASALASVSWAFLVMAGIAALALQLLDADAVGELGPMTAAATVLAVGGSVSPSGDIKAFGMENSATDAAVDITPLGVSLAGALVLGWLFTRSLRQTGAFIERGELAARAGSVVVLFTALLSGLGWAGSGAVTIDGSSLPLPEGGGLPGGLGDLGGGFGGAIGDMAEAETSVGFEVNMVPSLLGGLGWVVAVLLISLAAARFTPLPRGWESVHRSVRPAASAMRTVAVLAVGAGLGAACYTAVTEDHPARIIGGALVGAPNGVWLALPLGLFVPWHGSATGALADALPDPLDDLLTGEDKPITVSRLAELDGRVWLLAVATALMLLTAGVLAASRTPVRGGTTAAFAGRCALRLAAVTALTLPLMVWLTGISADASLSMFGVDAVGAGVDIHGSVLLAVLIGAAWGAGAGGLGALLARATGAAGSRAAPLARGAVMVGSGRWGADQRTYPDIAYEPGPYNPAPGYQPPGGDPNPYAQGDAQETGPGIFNAPTVSRGPDTPPPTPPPRRSPGSGAKRPEETRPAGPPPPGPRPPGKPGTPRAPGRRPEGR